MSDTSRIQREAPRVLWLVAAFVLVAGYYSITTRYEQAIEVALTTSEHYYSATVANERIVHDSSRLVALQKKVDGDLVRLRTRDSIVSTEQLLQVLEGAGRRFDVNVLSIQPEQIAINKEKTEGLAGTGLTIRIRGKFRGILLFIEQLPRRDALLTVDNTEMRLQAGDSAATADPILEATLHASTYTIQSPTEEPRALAR